MQGYPSPAPAASNPAGGPPLPEGWISQWNDQYKAWFFVNTQTGVSQWEPPVPAPAHSPLPGADARPAQSHDTGSNPFRPDPAAQEAQDQALAARLQAEEDARYGQPYSPVPPSQSHGAIPPNTTIADSDAELAARLQAEEDARARGHSSQQGYPQGSGQTGAPQPFGHQPSYPGAPIGQGGPYPPQQPYGGGLHPQLSYGQSPSPGPQPGQPYGQSPGQYLPHEQQQQQQQQSFGQQPQYGQGASGSGSKSSGGLLGKLTSKAKSRLSAAGFAGAGAGAGYGASQHSSHHSQQGSTGYPGQHQQPTQGQYPQQGPYPQQGGFAPPGVPPPAQNKKKSKFGLPLGAAAGGAGAGMLGGALLSKLSGGHRSHGHGGYPMGGGYGHGGGGYYGNEQHGEHGGDAGSVSSSDPGGSDYGGGGGDFGGGDDFGGDFGE